ncbi:MAG: lipid-binding SYLF domain-containing protein [Inquilinus sp.]|nr:lipid-binding SYLF domain-containing protein [Inquilinus sp.]
MKRFSITSIAAVAAAIVLATPAQALTDQEELVEKARITVQALLADPNYPALRGLLEEAEGVLIVPELVKGGFFIGAEGGNGVLLARQADGSWSDPSFVMLTSGSFGLQIGGEISEVVLAINSEDGLNAILDRKARIGADVSAALFTVGAGVEAGTGIDTNADMIAFSRSKGLFAGGALEGSVISEKKTWNTAYYGAAAAPRDILAGRHANPHSHPLGAALPR